MKIIPRNLIHHELIGLETEFLSSNDQPQKVIKGRILDETRNTFLIETKLKNRIRISKKTTFKFNIPNEPTIQIEGEVLIGKPEDRLKMREKLW